MSTQKQNNKIKIFNNAILKLEELNFNHIKELLLDKFKNKTKLFDLKKNLKDEFIESEQDPLYFYNWYTKINNNYEPIGNINPSLPEMGFLLANIAKDLIILFITKRFHGLTNKSNNTLKNNIRKLESSLKEVNYISN